MTNTKKKIQIKILGIEKISNYDNDPEKFELNGTKIKDSKINYGSKVNLNPAREIVEIVTFANFYLEKNTKKLQLFGIETKHIFQVMNFQEVFETQKKGTYKIPDSVMLTLFNISISGMRGMLALLNTRYEYKDLTFPIINSSDLLKGVKKK